MGGASVKWQFSNDAPIYSQLIAQIKVGIVSGAFPPGERLPSVRDLATEAGVNPNTMQRGAGRSGAPGPSVHQSDQRTVCDGG